MTDNIFLTQNELSELTGYVNANKQCEFLGQINLKYIKNAANRPIVMRDALREWFAPKKSTNQRIEPNRKALLKAQGNGKTS